MANRTILPIVYKRMNYINSQLTCQHIYFLGKGILAILQRCPINSFSFCKTDFNFGWQHLNSALIRYYLFCSCRKKKKVRLLEMNLSIYIVKAWNKTYPIFKLKNKIKWLSPHYQSPESRHTNTEIKIAPYANMYKIKIFIKKAG